MSFVLGVVLGLAIGAIGILALGTKFYKDEIGEWPWED